MAVHLYGNVNGTYQKPNIDLFEMAKKQNNQPIRFCDTEAGRNVPAIKVNISEEGLRALHGSKMNGSVDIQKQMEEIGGSVGVNVGKTARKIAAAKTTSQLRAVIAEIKGDMQEVKAGIEKGWCDESEMEKVNSLMAQAQNRMGQVEDREATPEEENMFAMASLM